MHPFKLGTMVAILATAAAFSAPAGSAEAQISGTIGGDVVAHDPLPRITLTRLTGTIHVDGYDWLGNVLGTAYDAPEGAPVHSNIRDILLDLEAATAALLRDGP